MLEKKTSHESSPARPDARGTAENAAIGASVAALPEFAAASAVLTYVASR